jgi:seryl-tRNA synthetase
MLDILLLRAEKGGDPEVVYESQRRRFKPVEKVDEVIQTDKEWGASTLRAHSDTRIGS